MYIYQGKLSGIEVHTYVCTSIRENCPALRHLCTSIREYCPALRHLCTSIRENCPALRSTPIYIYQVMSGIEVPHLCTSIREYCPALRHLCTSNREYCPALRHLCTSIRECGNTHYISLTLFQNGRPPKHINKKAHISVICNSLWQFLSTQNGGFGQF